EHTPAGARHPPDACEGSPRSAGSSPLANPHRCVWLASVLPSVRCTDTVYSNAREVSRCRRFCVNPVHVHSRPTLLRHNCAVRWISRAMGAIHFCLPWPGSGFSVTRRTPTRSNAWTSRVTALRSRFSFRARSVMEPGAALTCLSKSTRFAVRTCSSDSMSSKATTRLGGIRSPRSAKCASLRPRSKNASARSTRISVFRTFCLFHQLAPLSLKTRLDLPKAAQPHGSHFAAKMTVMLAVGRIIAPHPAIVARVDKGIDVSEVVPNDAASAIDPDFPAENAATFRLGQIMTFIRGFPDSGSHDPRYHICCVAAEACCPIHKSQQAPPPSVRTAIYSLFPEIPIRYATTHASGFSGLPGDGLCRRRGALREPRQERVSAQQRGSIAHPLRGIRHVRVALDPHGGLSGQARQEVRADAGPAGGVDRAAECRLWTHFLRPLPADRTAGGRGRGHSAGLRQSDDAGRIRSREIRAEPFAGAVRESYRIAIGPYDPSAGGEVLRRELEGDLPYLCGGAGGGGGGGRGFARRGEEERASGGHVALLPGAAVERLRPDDGGRDFLLRGRGSERERRHPAVPERALRYRY